MSKPRKKIREKSKTRTWEKERRNRINSQFTQLWQVLPIYDASKPLSKIDILINAISTIKDLDEKLRKILVDSSNEKTSKDKISVSSDLIKRLQERVKKLLRRNEELFNLLSTAGIKVPAKYGNIKHYKQRLKYPSISADQQRHILQKELEKENQVKVPKSKRVTKPRANNKQRFAKLKNEAAKVQHLSPLSNCLFLVSQATVPNNMCIILSKEFAKLNQSILSHSLLMKAPIVSSNIKPSFFPMTSQLPAMNSKNVLLGDGPLMVVVPASKPIPFMSTIISNPITSYISNLTVSPKSDSKCTSEKRNDTRLILKTNSQMVISRHDISNSLPVLKPKLNITKTTQANKVPIPALTSNHNKFLYFDQNVSENVVKSQEPKNSTTVKKRKCDHYPKSVKKQKTKAVKTNEKENDSIPVSFNKNGNAISGDSCAHEKNISEIQTIIGSVKESPVKRTSKVFSDTAFNPNASLLHVAEAENNNLRDQESNVANKFSVSEAEKNDMIALEPSVDHNDKIVCDDIALKTADSNNFEFGTFPNNCSQSSNVSNLHPGKQVSTCMNTSTSVTVNMSSESVTSDPLSLSTTFQNKSFPLSSAGVKQAPKPYELTSLHTDTTTHNSTMNDLKTLEMNLPQTELSNDIFASFQVPPGCQNADSTSPTAAFLLAFPLVSSGAKVAEVMDGENSQSQTATPNLLQIGTMDLSKPTQTYAESLTPNLLNFDSFSFFNNKESFSGLYGTSSLTYPSNTLTSAKTIYSNPDATSTANNLGTNSKNEQSKPTNDFEFSRHHHYDKNETSCNKIQNQHNKEHSKFTTYEMNPVSCSKQQSPGVPNDIDKNMHVDTNILDINRDMCVRKPNKSFLTTSKQNNELLKPSSYCSDYKSCNLSIGNNMPSNRNNSVYTNRDISNTYHNGSVMEEVDKHFNSTTYNNYPDYSRKSYANNYNNSYQICSKEKTTQNQVPAKVKPPQNKPVNWMTTPTISTPYKSDYFLPAFSKEPSTSSNFEPNTLSSNVYFNSSVYNTTEHFNTVQDFRKLSELSVPSYGTYQRNDTDENQFSCSPNKLHQFMDSTHSHSFASATLPTLMGDLAPVLDQKKERIRDNRRKNENCETQNGQTRFLSVSQLVEPNPAKIASRRISGNKTKNNATKNKRIAGRSDANKDVHNYQKIDKSNNCNIYVATNLFNETKQPTRNNNKSNTSSYSAEALISNSVSNDISTKRNNNSFQKKFAVPNFSSDNYYPTVELPQDNSYVYPGQGNQSNSFVQNFTTFQNANYNTNNFIPNSSYMSTSSLMPSANAHDFLGENSFQTNNSASNKEKCNFAKSYYRSSENKDDKNTSYSCKKAKKRLANENTQPSFDLHFFSMPGTINSPILPDDFHTTYLPPTTLYSCKNPLYSKPNSETIPTSFIPPLLNISGNRTSIQNPQMSPSVSSAGTSLTNFNLSTIFPEINKGPGQDHFPDSQNKDCNLASKRFSMPSSLQVHR